MATREECLAGFGQAMAASDLACDAMTPREQAEAAWTPTCKRSVDELEAEIRTARGMPPLDRGQVAS